MWQKRFNKNGKISNSQDMYRHRRIGINWVVTTPLVEKKIIILRAGGQMYGYIYDYQNFLGLNFTCSTKIHELHYNMSLDCLLERVIITFTSNVKREFVPRVPLLVAYCSLFLLINKTFFIRIV